MRFLLGPTRWLWPVLGWGVLARGAAPSSTVKGMIGGTIGGIGTVIMSHETFTVVDLHPVRGKTFRDLVTAEIARARQRGQHSFLELGGSGCGVCHALHNHLDTRPLSPQVRAAFAGTDIIRVAIEEWPNASAALGLRSDERIPVYVALDTMGRMIRRLSIDYWTLRSLDTDTLSSVQQFFRGQCATRHGDCDEVNASSSTCVPVDEMRVGPSQPRDRLGCKRP